MHAYMYVCIHTYCMHTHTQTTTRTCTHTCTHIHIHTQGRGGKGSIFIWASGNGGLNSDCCAADGYVTNVYTIAIGSASSAGTAVYYDEKCSAKMAVVYMYTTSGSVQVVGWGDPCRVWGSIYVGVWGPSM